MTIPAEAQALATKALAAAGMPAPRGGGARGNTGGADLQVGPVAVRADLKVGPSLAADQGDAARGQATGRRGGGGGGRPWVRGMLTRRDGRLSLSINGQPVFTDVAAPGASSRGRLLLKHQDRPIDFASIFVKTLN
jgi:hypothetical protein